VGAERVVRCVSCRTPHHAVCFDEHGGCVAFGCGGVGKSDAGQSIMIKRPTIAIGARWREAVLHPGDRVVRFRTVARIAEEDVPPKGSRVRLSFEHEKLYAGQDLKGRIVVAVTRDTVVRNLEVRVYDEPTDPIRDARGAPARLLAARLIGRPPFARGSRLRAVIGLARPRTRLRAGHHPFQIEIPRVFGSLIARADGRTVQVGVVLERHGEPTIASPRVVVELLPTPVREIPLAPARSYPSRGRPENAVMMRNGENLLAAFGQPVVAMPPPPFDLDMALGRIDRVGPDRTTDPNRGGAWPASLVRLVAPPPANAVSGAGPTLGAPIAEAGPSRPSDDLIGPPRDTDSSTEATGRYWDDAPAAKRPDAGQPVAPFPLEGGSELPLLSAAAPAMFDPFKYPDPFARPDPFAALAAPSGIDVSGVLGDDAGLPPRDAGAPPQGGAAPPPAPRPSGLPLAESPREAAPAPSTPPPASGGDGWVIFAFRAVSTAGPRTGRVIRARFAPRADLPPLRLSLEVPPQDPEDVARVVQFAIDSPFALETLDLACRYEVHDAAGAELTLGKFPMVEEVAVVGEKALDAARTGKEERILLAMPIDPFLLDEARGLSDQKSAPPAELVLRLACEGVDRKGASSTSGTRVVRVPLALAPSAGMT
jgi:hypothetical protein